MNLLRVIFKHRFVRLLIVILAFTSIIGLSPIVIADTENASIPPGMFYAMFLQMSKGVEFEFSVTSDNPIHVCLLDSNNYNFYMNAGTYGESLFDTIAPVFMTSGIVEAPETGKYYLVMENSVSSQTASVTVEYDFLGTGFELSGLIISMIIGVVIAGVVGLVVVILLRASGKRAREDEYQKPPPIGPFPPIRP